MIDEAKHRIERYFMRPLSAAALIGGVLLLISGAWVVGTLLIIACLGIGVAGVRLHPSHTFSQLTQAVPPETTLGDVPAALRMRELERPVVTTSTWAVIAAAAVLSHEGLRFYIWVPAAIALYVFLTFLGGAIARGAGRSPLVPPTA